MGTLQRPKQSDKNPISVEPPCDNSLNIDIPDMETKLKTANEYQLSILCVDLSKKSPITQFLSCCLCIFIFYLMYGFLQELIFAMEGFKAFGWYLTMTQFLLYSIFGYIEVRVSEIGPRRMPLKCYILLSFLTVGTMGFSNASLGYLNYPTQVIFKCCKLIPVLIGGIILQGRAFSSIDWVACFCMSCGLIFFTLADSMVLPNFNFYGLILISIALCFDAAIGNLQEKFMRKSQAANAEVVLYSYAIGFVYIFIGQLISRQLFEGFLFCLENPRVYVYIFFFSFSGYLGVNVVLSLVQMHGALIAVTVTTFRKALTIILSFIIFSKPFTFQYLWSGLIVLLGIYLNIYSKNKASWDEKIFSRLKAFLPGSRKKLISIQNFSIV